MLKKSFFVAQIKPDLDSLCYDLNRKFGDLGFTEIDRIKLIKHSNIIHIEFMYHNDAFSKATLKLNAQAISERFSKLLDKDMYIFTEIKDELDNYGLKISIPCKFLNTLFKNLELMDDVMKITSNQMGMMGS